MRYPSPARHLSFRHPAALSIAIAAALSAAAGAAHAQTPVPTDEATTLDALTVTGYRHSIERSLDQKREANSIVEVITAEDISKFPDRNVADALQRVPGVIITRDGGEGKTVSIRGLAADLTLTQLNGNYVASSETNDAPTRSFNYVLMPSNMLSSVELFKTPEARIDEGGIGGTVILHTRRPLEIEANTGFFSAESTWSNTSRSFDPQVAGMYSWKSQDERFGALAGVSYQKRSNRSMEVGTSSWRWWADRENGDGAQLQKPTDVNGNRFANESQINTWGGNGVYDQAGNHYSGYWIQQSVRFGIRDEERERRGAQLTFQFKPVDQLTLTANYFRFNLNGDYVFNMNGIPEWGFSSNWNGSQGKLLAPNGLTFDPSGTIVTGARFQVPEGGCSLMVNPVTGEPRNLPCTMETPQLRAEWSREEALSQTADFAAEWRGERFEATFKGGRTWSQGGPSMLFEMSAKPRRFGNQNGNFYSAWDLTGTPSFEVSPEIQQNLMAGIAEVDVGSTDSSWQQTWSEQRYYQLDMTQLFMSDWLDSFQYGVKYRDGHTHRNTGKTLWYCQGTQTRYQSCDPDRGLAYPEFFLSQPIGNIRGGFRGNVFPAIDAPAYLDYLNNRFGGPVRFEEDNFVYNIEETLWSGYFQANIRTERLRGNLGVRVVRTKQHSDTTDRVIRYLDYYEDDANGNPAICPASGIYNGITCVGGDFVYLPRELQRDEGWARIDVQKTFTDVLPSFNLAYDLTETLLLRAAASKVIARTGYSDLGRLGSLEFYTQEYYDDRGQFGAPLPGWYGSGGNKELDPYEAIQYDLGLEWYYQPGSVLGAGLFRKNVKNFIVPVELDREQVIEGQTVLVRNFSTQANGRDGVSQGVEVYAQHTFQIGVGFQANYTWNDTNLSAIVLNGEDIGTSPLVGSAKNQANVTVFYENDKFLARASYNRRGEVVGGLSSGLNIYSDPYDQIDLNFGYNLSDDLALTASVLNLTESEQRRHLGNDSKDRFYSNVYSGRIFYLGMTYQF